MVILKMLLQIAVLLYSLSFLFSCYFIDRFKYKLVILRVDMAEIIFKSCNNLSS